MKIIKSICILSIILLFIILSKKELEISNKVYHNNNITINNQITKENNILNNYNYLNIYKKYKLIALTFDDGPSHNTSRLLDILNKYQVKATFFLVGTNVNKEKDIVKKIDSSGMEIGNHTYSHKILSHQEQEDIKLEIDKTNDLIYNITGKYPTLFRPSYGQTNKIIRKISNMPIITWNIDTLDWKYHSSNYIVNSILSKVKEGDIILMHDIYTSSINAIDKLLPKLLEKGYMPVTVSELFYYKNIELEKGKIYNHAK